MTYVKSLSADRLKEEFERLQIRLSTLTQQDFTRASKRLGDELEQPSSKRPTPAEVEATSAAMEDTMCSIPILSVSCRSSKESKRLWIENGGISDEYASDEEDDSDCDTLVPFYAVVDWEMLPTGLGTINVIYRKDNSLKYFTSLREILHLVLIDSTEVDDGSEFWQSQHNWRIQSWKLYSFSGIHVLETVSGLVIYMFVDKKYPLTVKLMERMMDYQLEIGHGAVGNELTTTVQLVKFLKKQITDSKRADVHDWKSKTNVPVCKPKIIKSISANKKEPSKSYGSIVSDVPSSSLDACHVVQIFLWYLDSGCSKYMTGDRSQLTNFVNKFLGTVKFENDHVAKILGYGDYQIGNVTISRVYYVKGLGHNLFSVGQFCDSNLEVAFRQHTCFIRNLEGVDLLTGSRGNNLYTLC
ncbi:hypothetical protein Tco_0471545 [Tanacetum coccineum]